MALVYDVGLHRGEDSAFYLALGHDVVAFEANPNLVAHCRARFASEIDHGRLRIVNGAIAASEGEIVFYKNEKSVWGTIQPQWAERNDHLFRYSTEITVPRVNFRECLSRYGTPHFIKIDVEGVDRLVVEAICNVPEPPKYLSMESEKADFEQLVDDIDQLRTAGYGKFKVIQQATIPGSVRRVTQVDGRPIDYRFENHSSGPFGEDLPGPWLTRDQAIEVYQSIFRRYRAIGDRTFVGRYGRILTKPFERVFGVGLPGWHDLHAKRT